MMHYYIVHHMAVRILEEEEKCNQSRIMSRIHGIIVIIMSKVDCLHCPRGAPYRPDVAMEHT